MNPIHAYAISGALIASITTWAFLQFPGLLIWAAFIGWAGFLHSGGTRAMIKMTVSCMAFGVAMAWLFAMLIAGGYIHLPVPFAAAVLVALIAPLIIVASKFDLLSIVPASFYGFACTFAFLAQTPGKFDAQVLRSGTLDNALIVVPLSLCIGVALGYLQTLIAGRMMQASEQ